MSEKIKGMAQPPIYTTTLLDKITYRRDGRISKKLFVKVIPPMIRELESQLAAEREKVGRLKDALLYYARDEHIRDYGNGQQVILDPDECKISDTDNKAGRTLKEIEE